MRVAIGADREGFFLKQQLVTYLKELRHGVCDVGTHTADAGDYRECAQAVAEAVAKGQAERGVLICGSGVRVSVTANKIPGIRAGLCHDTYSARQGVEHVDMNVLVIGFRVIGVALAREIVHAYLSAVFPGSERHRGPEEGGSFSLLPPRNTCADKPLAAMGNQVGGYAMEKEA